MTVETVASTPGMLAPLNRGIELSGLLDTRRFLEDASVDFATQPPPAPESLRTLDGFFYWREEAEAHGGVRDERQAAIRDDVGRWLTETFPDVSLDKPGSLDDYTHQAVEWSDSMLGKLIDYLGHEHTGENGMSWTEYMASKYFLNATLAINADTRAGVDLSAGEEAHAFVVPVRLSSNNPEYSREMRPLVPALHYVPDKLVPLFMRDLPTFVADRYQHGGHVVVAPITDDMRVDLCMRQQEGPGFFRAARGRVNAAVAVGEALGDQDFGYGATLPGLMKWGKHTENTEVTTTTGHGGTTALMSMILKKAVERFMPDKKPEGIRIGFLGLGTIGLSGAQVVAELHPDNQVSAFDPDRRKVDQLVDSNPQRFQIHDDAKGVIDSSDIILSTAGTTFNLKDPARPNYLPVASLEGKVIIDDSEPHSFLPNEVEALGGVVLDVVGRDWSGWLKRSTTFGYGHTLADRQLDAFGCELEVACLHRLRLDLHREGSSPEQIKETINQYALRGPVTAELTRKWIALFERYGIGPAPLQAFGAEV